MSLALTAQATVSTTNNSHVGLSCGCGCGVFYFYGRARVLFGSLREKEFNGAEKDGVVASTVETSAGW